MILGIIIGVVACLMVGLFTVVLSRRGKRHATVNWEAPAPSGTARPVDPQDPPRTVLCPPRVAAKGTVCTCHQRPLVAGERMMIWPIPGSKTPDHPSGAFDLLCSETLTEAGT